MTYNRLKEDYQNFLKTPYQKLYNIVKKNKEKIKISKAFFKIDTRFQRRLFYIQFYQNF